MQEALLVIDAQQEYFSPWGKWVVEGGPEALARIQMLLSAFRDAGFPVVHITHEALDPASPVFRAGSEGVRLHSDLSVATGELVVKKHFPGSFTQTPLEAYLRRAGVDTLVVSGFQTHHCCDTTTRQARERGFGVLFAEDATATRDLTLQGRVVTAAEVKRASLAVIEGFGAQVLTTAEITERIQHHMG